MLNLDSVYLHELKGEVFSLDQASEWAYLFLQHGYEEVSIHCPNTKDNSKLYTLIVPKLKNLEIKNA